MPSLITSSHRFSRLIANITPPKPPWLKSIMTSLPALTGVTWEHLHFSIYHQLLILLTSNYFCKSSTTVFVSQTQHLLGSDHTSQTVLMSSLSTVSLQKSFSQATASRKGQSSGRRSSSRTLKTSTLSSTVTNFTTTASPMTSRCTSPPHGQKHTQSHHTYRGALATSPTGAALDDSS